MKHGSKYTANNADFGRFSVREDSEEMMQHHRKLLKKYRKAGDKS